MSVFSQSECLAWFGVFFANSFITVLFNVVTIIIFTTNRQLCKRSTYLMINLAFVDLFVGGVTGTRHVIIRGQQCGLWPWQPVTSLNYVMMVLALTFPVASLENLAVISIERLFATVRPFRHRYAAKLAYAVAIFMIWLTALTSGLLITALTAKTSGRVYLYVWTLVNLLSLSAICVSYTVIAVKVRQSGNLTHSERTAKERKLTMTLLLVTAISILSWVPRIALFYLAFFNSPLRYMSPLTTQRINNISLLAYLANSFINPVLYAVRMPEFKRGLQKLFCCRELRPRPNAIFPLSARTGVSG